MGSLLGYAPQSGSARYLRRWCPSLNFSNSCFEVWRFLRGDDTRDAPIAGRLHELRKACTNCVRLVDTIFPTGGPLFGGDRMVAAGSTHYFTAVDSRYACLQCANASATDRHRIVLGGV